VDRVRDVSDEAVDEQALRELYGDAWPETLVALAPGFLEHAGAAVETVRAAADAGDLTALAGEAHALAGAAGAVGARRFMEVARTLENLAAEGVADLDAPVASLAQEAERVRLAIAQRTA
jgi:HPt (histidine-containing phosphotransfer) domain-containing protein